MSASLAVFQSDVLLGQSLNTNRGFGMKTVTVTIKAGMGMGAALEATSVAGKYTWVAAGTVADTAAVLVDPRAQGYVEPLPAGDHLLVVACLGVTINEEFFALNGGSAANKTSAIAAFEAKGNEVSGNTKSYPTS